MFNLFCIFFNSALVNSNDEVVQGRILGSSGQFLVGIIETAKSGVGTFDAILQLKREVDEQAQTLGSRAGHVTRLLDTLYQHPFIDADGVSRACNVSMPTAYKLIADLERLGILSEITGNRRNRKYLFERYLRLFQ